MSTGVQTGAKWHSGAPGGRLQIPHVRRNRRPYIAYHSPPSAAIVHQTFPGLEVFMGSESKQTRSGVDILSECLDPACDNLGNGRKNETEL